MKYVGEYTAEVNGEKVPFEFADSDENTYCNLKPQGVIYITVK